MGQLVYAGGRDGVPQIPLILCKECSTIFVPHGRFQKPSLHTVTPSPTKFFFSIFFSCFGHPNSEQLCEDDDDIEEDADC